MMTRVVEIEDLCWNCELGEFIYYECGDGPHFCSPPCGREFWADQPLINLRYKRQVQRLRQRERVVGPFCLWTPPRERKHLPRHVI